MCEEGNLKKAVVIIQKVIFELKKQWLHVDRTSLKNWTCISE